MKMKNVIILLVLTLAISAQAAVKVRGVEAAAAAQAALKEKLVSQRNVSAIVDALVANLTQALDEQIKMRAHLIDVQADVTTLDQGLGNLEVASKTNSDEIKKLKNPNGN